VKRAALKRRPAARRIRTPEEDARWNSQRKPTCAVTGVRVPRWVPLHHVVKEQHVERRGGDSWDPRNSLTVSPAVHANHHSTRKIPVGRLRPENFAFARELLGAAAPDYFARYYDVDVDLAAVA
jgi:hypothetical protein